MTDALEHFDAVLAVLDGRPPALFLDFDGTLTRLVDDPSAVFLAPRQRRALDQVAGRWPVALISGRDLPDLRARVGSPMVSYAGSHGFDIETRTGQHFRPHDPPQALAEGASALDAVAAEIPGTWVERKAFATALHYRGVRESASGRDWAALARTAAGDEPLIVTEGDHVVELRPDLAWHKGSAVTWFLNRWSEAGRPWAPVFVGDDVTDEDGFAAVADTGIGVLVGCHPSRRTRATFTLPGPDAVAEFLERLSAVRPAEGEKVAR